MTAFTPPTHDSISPFSPGSVHLPHAQRRFVPPVSFLTLTQREGRSVFILTQAVGRAPHRACSLWAVCSPLWSVHPRAQAGSCSSSRRGRFCLPHALVRGSLFGFAHAASWESSLAGMNFCCVCSLLLISPMFWVVVVLPTIFGCGCESDFFFKCGLHVCFFHVCMGCVILQRLRLCKPGCCFPHVAGNVC